MTTPARVDVEQPTHLLLVGLTEVLVERTDRGGSRRVLIVSERFTLEAAVR